MLDNIRIKIENTWQWLQDHPKKTFRYMLIILVASTLFFIIKIFFLENFNSTITTTSRIPTVLGASDKYIEKEREKIGLREDKMGKIVKELEFFKNKKVLVKSDSVRIEYLLNQYSKLKNEK